MESLPHVDSFAATKNCVSCRKPILSGRISSGHVHKGKSTIIASFCSVCGELKAFASVTGISKCDSPMGCYGFWTEDMGECVI